MAANPEPRYRSTMTSQHRVPRDGHSIAEPMVMLEIQGQSDHVQKTLPRSSAGWSIQMPL